MKKDSKVIFLNKKLNYSFLKFFLIFFFILIYTLLCSKTNLKVGIYQNSPKVFEDSNGVPKGFFVDILNEISSINSITVDFIFGSWTENLEKLKYGELDALVDISYSEDRAEFFLFNRIPVIESWIQVFSPPNSNIFKVEDLNEKNIGVLENSTQHSYLVNKLKNDFDITYKIFTYSDYSRIIQALNKREIDLFLGDRFFFFSKERTEGIIANPVIINPGGIYFAFRKDIDQAIIEQFDSALFTMKNNYYSKYYTALNKWFNIEVKSELPNWIKNTLLILLSASAFFIIFVFLRNYRKIKNINKELEERVEERTKFLNEALISAKAANNAKSSFLSNMSHEIRTPLNAIIGFAQILVREKSFSMEQIGKIKAIERSGEHLLKLINDILDLSRIESGKFNLEINDFNLHIFFEEIESMLKFRAEEKGLYFRIKKMSNIPECVSADEVRLRQVIINLLGNAVKFTGEGGVTLGIASKILLKNSDQEKDNILLRIDVEDTGSGIPAEDMNRIFESFHLSSAGRMFGGTGLGLSISLRLAKLMGGEIKVKSILEKGSTFSLLVPVKVCEKADFIRVIGEERRIIGMEPGTKKIKILIADDCKDNRDLLQFLLEPLGFLLKMAKNGREAINIFEDFSPDAVLMDMRMPIIDGYEATRQIKSTEKGKKTKVIAVTASAFAEDEKKVLETGVDGYVRKPIIAEYLFEELKKVLGINYIYEEIEETATSGMDENENITKKDISILPKDLVSKLLDAVEQGEMERLLELISKVEPINKKAAKGLLKLAQRFEYEKLISILEN